MTTQARLTERQKVQKAMSLKGKSFAFRLAMACAMGKDKGQLTCFA